ncbi:MAG: histidine kinase dimerization/phospho-acceptor domain-containing protein, partial [Pseudomonadota bacterium]
NITAETELTSRIAGKVTTGAAVTGTGSTLSGDSVTIKADATSKVIIDGAQETNHDEKARAREEETENLAGQIIDAAESEDEQDRLSLSASFTPESAAASGTVSLSQSSIAAGRVDIDALGETDLTLGAGAAPFAVALAMTQTDAKVDVTATAIDGTDFAAINAEAKETQNIGATADAESNVPVDAAAVLSLRKASSDVTVTNTDEKITGSGVSVGSRVTRDLTLKATALALGSGQELPDKAAAAQVRRTLGAYGDSLRGLNRAFLQLEVDAQTQTNALLLAKSSQLSAFAAATGVICLLLVMFYAADARRERRKTADTERLLRASAAAERSKARFLATMSHELHTPMNGVLGMIALARQPGLPGPQDRMLDRAAEAARQMDALLSDILDFAALEDDDATLDRAPFDPRALADQLAARLSPQAQREGATVHVIVEPGLPEKVLGDARRVKQALARLGGYLLQTSDAAVLQVTVSYRDGALRVEMGWPGGQGPSDLGAVALDGLSRDGPSPGIETEAVGLIVARGYLAKMHAQVALFGESRPVLRVVIPAVLATGAIRDAAPTLPTPRDTARGR